MNKKSKSIFALSLILIMTTPNTVYATNYATDLTTQTQNAVDSIMKKEVDNYKKNNSTNNTSSKTNPIQQKVYDSLNPTKAQLNIPTLYRGINGKMAIIWWDKIPNATNYTVCVDTYGIQQTTKSTAVELEIKDFNDITFKVRAEDSTNKYAPSNYSSITVEIPDYKNFTYYDANLLSLDQLKNWADINEKDYEIIENKSQITLRMSTKDTNNSGIWNRIKRAGNRTTNRYSQSLDEQLNEVTDDDVIYDIITNSDESGSLIQGAKDTYKEYEDEMTTKATVDSAISGLGALTENTNIIQYYIFDAKKTEHSCIGSFISFEKTRNEDMINAFSEPNGWYHVKDNIYQRHYGFHNRTLYAEIILDTSDKLYPRYNITFYFEK